MDDASKLRTTLWLPVLASALLILACAVKADAETVQIPGTRVVLNVPADFELSESFAGVQHKREKAAIAVTEVPDSYLEFTRTYTDDALRRKGYRVLRRQRMDRDGLSGQLIVVEQSLAEQKFERWIAITGDTKESVVIAAYFPARLAARFRDAIERALASAFWDSAQVLDHFAGLGYRLDDVPDLRVASRLNNNLVFTGTGRLPDQYYTGALMFVNFLPYPTGTRLGKEFAIDQFNKISLLSGHHIDSIQMQKLRGTDAIVIEGSGTHSHLGYAIAAFQVIAMTPTGALMAQGFTTLDNRENDFDVFKNTIGSFRLEGN